jgi:hypothetical protein
VKSLCAFAPLREKLSSSSHNIHVCRAELRWLD